MKVKAGDVVQAHGDGIISDRARCYSDGDEFTVYEDEMGFFIHCKWAGDNQHRLASKDGEVWDENLRLMSGEKEL